MYDINTAAKSGNLILVRQLIDKNPELLDIADEYNQTPLLWAAAYGHEEIVDYLIEKSANLNIKTDYPNSVNHGKTPLCYAIEGGYQKIAINLIKNGAAITETIQSPIILAASRGLLNVVQVLIERDPELLEKTDLHNQTPLIWAAANGYEEVVNYLISKSADLHVVTIDPENTLYHKTPLYWAIEYGYSNVAISLIKNDLTIKMALGIYQYQYQLFKIAIQKGLQDVVNLLSEYHSEFLKPNFCMETRTLQQEMTVYSDLDEVTKPLICKVSHLSIFKKRDDNIEYEISQKILPLLHRNSFSYSE